MRLVSVLSLLVLAACAAPSVPPYSQLAVVTSSSGAPVRGGQGGEVRGGWYPSSYLAEGGAPDKGESAGGGKD
jgi:hypothetical protein